MTHTLRLKTKLEKGGCVFEKEEIPSIQRVWWNCKLDGEMVATAVTLGDCVKKAAEALGEES